MNYSSSLLSPVGKEQRLESPFRKSKVVLTPQSGNRKLCIGNDTTPLKEDKEQSNQKKKKKLIFSHGLKQFTKKK